MLKPQYRKNLSSWWLSEAALPVLDRWSYSSYCYFRTFVIWSWIKSWYILTLCFSLLVFLCFLKTSSIIWTQEFVLAVTSPWKYFPSIAVAVWFPLVFFLALAPILPLERGLVLLTPPALWLQSLSILLPLVCFRTSFYHSLKIPHLFTCLSSVSSIAYNLQHPVYQLIVVSLWPRTNCDSKHSVNMHGIN